MNPYVRDRIHRKLETLNDERLYQVLDYVEFLEARYAEKPATPVTVLQRFAEGVEDTMRSGGLAVSTISETMGLLNRAVGVLNNVTQATMTVAGDVVTAARTAVDQVGAPVPSSNSTPQSATPPVPPGAPAVAPQTPNTPHVQQQTRPDGS
ncbi:MAG: hypothetical protein IT353_00300 [Gemmatimonadaceae bacterium]|nr:hypothetical protein [Gemmatimonadaceae bacterium]